jgi:phosphoserine aminotransferase
MDAERRGLFLSMTRFPSVQTPSILSWKVQADNGNIYNTPNIFSIWALECITADLLAKGGLVTAGDRARRRAQLVIFACMPHTSMLS